MNDVSHTDHASRRRIQLTDKYRPVIQQRKTTNGTGLAAVVSDLINNVQLIVRPSETYFILICNNTLSNWACNLNCSVMWPAMIGP